MTPFDGASRGRKGRRSGPECLWPVTGLASSSAGPDVGCAVLRSAVRHRGSQGTGALSRAEDALPGAGYVRPFDVGRRTSATRAEKCRKWSAERRRASQMERAPRARAGPRKPACETRTETIAPVGAPLPRIFVGCVVLLVSRRGLPSTRRCKGEYRRARAEIKNGADPARLPRVCAATPVAPPRREGRKGRRGRACFPVTNAGLAIANKGVTSCSRSRGFGFDENIAPGCGCRGRRGSRRNACARRAGSRRAMRRRFQHLRRQHVARGAGRGHLAAR